MFIRMFSLVLSIGLVQQLSGATLIDFETLPDGTPTSSLPPLTPVKDSYESLGVVFGSRDPVDPTEPTFGSGSGAPSMTVRDFSRSLVVPDSVFHVVARFSSPTRSVSADVYSALNHSVTMIAKDSTGNILDSRTSISRPFGLKGNLSISDVGYISSVEWISSNPILASVQVDNLVFDSLAPRLQRQESRLVSEPSARNLVLVTHGWNGNMGWVNAIAQATKDRIIQNPDLNLAEWAVVPYDWTDLAGNLPLDPKLPNTALASAIELGLQEGRIIGRNRYDNVHLIGHSAGSALIEYAARQIKRESPETQVHTTFLDAYAPGRFGDFYGQAADWADHYLNSGDWPWTQAVLSGAHNVNVTNLDPTPTPLNPAAAHGWPHEFYLESIGNPSQEFGGYGFALAVEGGSGLWNPGLEYPLGAYEVIGSGAGLVDNLVSTLTFGKLNFEDVQATVSNTGQVIKDKLKSTFLTGSPVWMVADIELVDSANMLFFDLEFTSEFGAEGLFVAYLDGVAVGIIDERLALSGLSSYEFYLGELEPGIHSLSFRLDPYTETPSSAELSNVEFGFSAVVPEPTSITLLGLGFGFLFFWRQRKPRCIWQDFRCQ